MLGQSITHCVKLHKDNANGRIVQVDNINIFLIEESRLFTDPVIPGPKSKYVQYTSQFETAHFFSISIVNTVKEIFKTVTTSVIKNTMVKIDNDDNGNNNS